MIIDNRIWQRQMPIFRICGKKNTVNPNNHEVTRGKKQLVQNTSYITECFSMK